MSSVKIQGDPSGTGIFTIKSPNSSTDRELVLPDEAGTVLTSASDLPAANLTGDVAAARITDALNASGSAPVYACRAWVNFNGTGTVAIRESGNVSSITDNATGRYTANFATAMPDANYSMTAFCTSEASGNANFVVSGRSDEPPSTSSRRVEITYAYSSNSNYDVPYINLAFFR